MTIQKSDMVDFTFAFNTFTVGLEFIFDITIAQEKITFYFSRCSYISLEPFKGITDLQEFGCAFSYRWFKA